MILDEDYMLAKPHPEPHLTGPDRLGTSREETLIVEDEFTQRQSLQRHTALYPPPKVRHPSAAGRTIIRTFLRAVQQLLAVHSRSLQNGIGFG